MEQKAIIEELGNDREFIGQLKAAADSTEIQKLFADRGISVSAAQIDELLADDRNGELSLDELDNVAGGDIGIIAGIAIILFLAGLYRGARCK